MSSRKAPLLATGNNGIQRSPLLLSLARHAPENLDAQQETPGVLMGTVETGSVGRVHVHDVAHKTDRFAERDFDGGRREEITKAAVSTNPVVLRSSDRIRVSAPPADHL